MGEPMTNRTIQMFFAMAFSILGHAAVSVDSETKLSFEDGCVLVTPDGKSNIDIRDGSLSFRDKDASTILHTETDKRIQVRNSLLFHRSQPYLEFQTEGYVGSHYVIDLSTGSVLFSPAKVGSKWTVYSDDMRYRAEIAGDSVFLYNGFMSRAFKSVDFVLNADETITKGFFDPNDSNRLFLFRGVSRNPADCYFVISVVDVKAGKVTKETSITNSAGLTFQADFPSHDPFTPDGKSFHFTEFATIADREYDLASDTQTTVTGTTGQTSWRSYQVMQSAGPAGDWSYIWTTAPSANAYLIHGMGGAPSLEIPERLLRNSLITLDMSQSASKVIEAYSCSYTGGSGSPYKLVNTKLVWKLP